MNRVVILINLGVICDGRFATIAKRDGAEPSKCTLEPVISQWKLRVIVPVVRSTQRVLN